ncbi:hypothetical protein D3C74_386350 [compost metagenome]
MTAITITKFTTDSALAWSTARSDWMSLKMSVVVVSASYPGIDPVMRRRIGSELKTLMMLMIAATARAGLSCGRMIEK